MSRNSLLRASQAALSRRRFFQASAAAVALGHLDLAQAATRVDLSNDEELNKAIAKLDPYFTPQAKFQDVSRGKPLPHSLPEEKKREVGLTRETWTLEIVSDPDYPAALGKTFTRQANSALTFEQLVRLGEKHAVRFPKVMTCLNIGCPLGMGIWEGVPLRELVWLTQPRENLRRVFYHGYHNDDPKQMFRSSLPIGRVLEDPFDLPPVIACYKLNGQWLEPKRGGPVRMVVPEAYGFKSVKWLNRLVLTNLYHANDTYANGNNDVDSPLKTFAATISVPSKIRAGQPIPVTGYAQVGIAGLSKVQAWVQTGSAGWPIDDPYFTNAPWTDVSLLPPPTDWGNGLPGGKLPPEVMGIGPGGKPIAWPMRLSKAYWATLLPGLPAGEHVLRCRAVDEKGIAQPMPRPFRKSGHAAIEEVKLIVQA